MKWPFKKKDRTPASLASGRRPWSFRKFRPSYEVLEDRRVPTSGMFIQGTVFQDANANNQFDVPPDLYQSGATIQLYTQNGQTLLGQTTSDANGYYKFDDSNVFNNNLTPGTYLVVETPPAGYANSGAQVHSQLNPGTVLSPSTIQVTLTDPAQPMPLKATYNTNNLQNSGLYKNVTVTYYGGSYSLAAGQMPMTLSGGSLSGPVSVLTFCVDFSEDFVLGTNIFQVSPESGLPAQNNAKPTYNQGRIAYLYNHYGVSAMANGASAAALQLAIWELEYDPTPDLSSGNFRYSGTLSSQIQAYINDSAGKSEPAEFLKAVSIVQGGWQSIIVSGSYNFANVPSTPQTATIGDRVWRDTNANGIQDSGESGISGVTVSLYTSGNTFVASTTTVANGNYLFTGLTPGDYFVQVTASAGYAFSPQDQGGDDAKDSDANTSTGKMAVTTLTSGEDDRTWDAGLYQPVTIGDFVWEDANGNGTQNAGEPGIGGVTVKLLNAQSQVIATQVTDGTGHYLFTAPPGTYTVQVDTSTLPAGFVATPTGQGGNPALDSNPNPSGTTPVTLTSGQSDLTVDFGYYDPVAVGDFVWHDLNANGIQDAGEPGISGVTLTLTGTTGAGQTITPQQMVTDANGGYLFSNLPPGTYTVMVAASNFAPGGALVGNTVTPTNAPGSTPANDSNGSPTSTMVISGNSDLTLDFGYFKTATIGDFVWNDSSANGIQDSGELGISGVTVSLFTSSNTLVASTTTDSNGLYLFTGLTPGDYYVKVTAPSGYFYSPQDQGSNDAKDSDANTSTGKMAVTTLTSGEDDRTWDAGLFQKATIGDRVWLDTNANGIQDAGELGISGVTVSLFTSGNTLVASTTTDANGNYLFTGLTPGDYYVQVTAPGGYSFSPQDQGGDDSKDSDARPSTGKMAVTTLSSGEDDRTWDAGLNQMATIGDRVWSDTNANGIQDSGELGISGVTVSLYTSSNTLISSTTTDANGLYLFTGLTPGDYYVQVTAPSGYFFSPQDQGGDDAKDSDANTSTGKMTVTTLISGEEDRTWDAGLYQKATIGDRVWLDTNANGIQDAGELGISGVTVSLYTSSNTLVASTTTDANGNYLFTGLTPGDYYVQVTAPGGNFFSPQDQGGDDSKDSDANTSTGKMAVTTLSSGEDDRTWDAGLYQKATIGDRVWLDTNANGIQDAGELGISGVTVSLFTSGNVLVASATTDANGNYLFTNLTPGDYYVQVTAPSGYFFSPQDQGGDDTKDSDANTSTGKMAVTTLTSGEDDRTWDAGLYQTASVGDFVWRDLNVNGIQDAGEPGVTGVTVQLLNSSNTVVATTTTDANGLYLFNNVTPGTYSVQFIAPSGQVFTPQDQGGDDSKDSDANSGTGQSASFTLTSGQSNLSLDAGLKPIDLSLTKTVNNTTPTVGSNVIFTITVSNAAGFSQATGVAVSDLLPAGLTYVSSSASQGSYSSGSGTWTVGTVNAGASATLTITATVTSGGIKTNTAEVSAADQPDIDSTPNNHNPAEDDQASVSVTPPGSIGDFVWRDLNANGVQDAGEPGISGVTVQLLQGSTVLATTTTDANGLYAFNGLAPGSYTVQFVAPSGYLFGPQGAGTTATDSNPNASGLTGTITLVSGQTDNTIDAGLYQTATIGDRVWSDTNANGIQDSGELGISGVTVSLYTSGNVLVASATTDANGLYLFTGLTPGDYYVQVTAPSGYFFSPHDQGSDDSKDSDANTSTGKMAVTTLTSGEDDRTWDAGLYQTASVGDFVWRDLNVNGIQDAGEPGVTGVTVQLLNSSNTVVATTTTDANGLYLFTNVTPGTYSVKFVAPSGQVFTLQDQGGNDAKDSDANSSTGQTATFTLTSGQSNLTLDAGLKPIDLSLTKTVNNSTPAVGSNVVFTITVSNAVGFCQATGVAVADVLPAGLTFVSASASQGGYSSGSGVWTVGTLNAGTSATLQITATVPTGGTKTNTAQVSAADQPDIDSTPNNNNPAEDDQASVSLTPPAQIGDYVWVDTNRNGQQDAGEPGIAGVTVKLLDSSGTTVLQTTTTDSSGLYSFTVAPGSYVVQVVTPAGSYDKFTTANVGSDLSDSDVSQATGKTGVITVVSGQTDNTNDAGLLPIDLQLSKTVNNTAPLVGSNVTFTLTLLNNNTGAGVSTATGVSVQDVLPAGLSFVSASASQGSYSNGTGVWTLGTLAPGASATLTITATVTSSGTKTNYAQVTAANQIDTDSTPNNHAGPTPVEDDEAAVTLTPAATGSLSGFVYKDVNLNGAKDAGEPGISGVLITLSGTSSGTVLTDSNGSYSFTGLVAGTYTLTETQPATYDDGMDSVGSLGGTLSNDQFSSITVGANQNGTNYNFGEVRCPDTGNDSSINSNFNGTSIPGDGRYIWFNSHVTSVSGGTGTIVLYFTNIKITFTSSTTGTPYVLTVPNAEIVINPTTTTPSTVYDTANGMWVTTVANDSSNPFIAGLAFQVPAGEDLKAMNPVSWEFEVYSNQAGVSLHWQWSAAVYTSFSTNYNALGVTPVDGFLPGASQSGTPYNYRSFVTGGARGGGGSNYTGSNSATGSASACYQGATPTDPGDFVWLDQNGNGIQDDGEPGIADVTVKLFDAGLDGLAGTGDDELLGTQVTDSLGRYQFLVGPGTYYVQFVAPAGLLFTLPNQGTDDALDSDADPLTGNSHVFTLAEGEIDLTIDAGFIKPSGIQIARSASQSVVRAGSQVTYTYQVSNTGSRPLSTVTVVDDNGTPGYGADDFRPTYVSGDTNNDGKLDYNEVWQYTATVYPPVTVYTTINNVKTAVGTLLTQVLPSGNIQATYLQSTTLNDNSYGANRVNWGSKNHSFSNLVSDYARFVFTNGAGQKVLVFNLDYISSTTSVASGYKSLGATGGDGKMFTGSATNCLSGIIVTYVLTHPRRRSMLLLKPTPILSFASDGDSLGVSPPWSLILSASLTALGFVRLARPGVLEGGFLGVARL